MDFDVSGALLQTGLNLTELALKGTATKVNSKIQTLKSEKDAEKLRNIYDEIINELLLERDEAVRIAQAYKQAYEQVSISDEDIEYLHNTLVKIIKLLLPFMPDKADQENNMIGLVKLLDKDTLKTMQLLGFNYKAAIGEPLTEACSEAIRIKLSLNTKNSNSNKSI
mgnify:FL=1